MAMSAEEIIQHIKNAFPDADITIEDLAGDGEHYKAIVKSDAFKGMTRVKQHKAVYDALEGKAGTTLHALALSTSVLNK